MKYGLIAERLGHSYSKIIHELLGRYNYDLMPMPKEDVEELLKKREFDGLNVTIPYKSYVIPFLDWISTDAGRIGAVNTIVNRGGKLCGYNTDYFGFQMTLYKAEFDVSGKNVLILGSGGTSKTVRTVCTDMGAKRVLVASRTPGEGMISYEASKEASVDFIINTTPCGMFPDEGVSAIDIRDYKNVSGVVDVVFNPLYTKLLLDCREAGIPHVNGLYMLVSQAMASAHLFTGKPVTRKETERIYKAVRDTTENAVLIGMPYSGKTTIGKLLAEKTGKVFIDTDDEVAKVVGNIPEYIRDYGERDFRVHESEVIIKLTKTVRGAVIATGGGAVLKPENIRALRENGRLYYIDRRVNLMKPDETRPLSSNKKALAIRYAERKNIYARECDIRITNNSTPERAVQKIMQDRIGK